jgi:hypothetical protein
MESLEILVFLNGAFPLVVTPDDYLSCRGDSSYRTESGKLPQQDTQILSTLLPFLGSFTTARPQSLKVSCRAQSHRARCCCIFQFFLLIPLGFDFLSSPFRFFPSAGGKNSPDFRCVLLFSHTIDQFFLAFIYSSGYTQHHNTRRSQFSSIP